MDAARAYRCRCRRRMRKRPADGADRDIDGRGLTDRLARHSLQGGERGFEREIDFRLVFGCDTCRRRDRRLRDRILAPARQPRRSEEHTYELPSLMRTSYAVLSFKNK